VEYCPVVYPDQFNQELSKNKAIHIYFAQAIPLITYIDESCLYLKEKKCGICETVCKNDAINFKQTPKKMEIKVGAIILSPGLEPFDPQLGSDYGYGRLQNVVTSMDYERLMCATGPYEGEILRTSDKKHPQKIAWIQCIGSRQVNLSDGNSYCSAVCCTYTQKQVILTKDHIPDAECTIFHNDIRAHGKDFERFYQRAEGLEGVRFIRSYVSIGEEIPDSKNVTIRYATPDDGVKEEDFDLVVLSVGLTPPTDAQNLASKFDIELNAHGFCEVDPTNPTETTKPGIFISGGFHGPVDIPESVFSASGAGSSCGELLDYRRGKLARERTFPTEKDVSEEEPRIGVFVCHCGANIGRVVDVPSAVEFAKTLPNVVYAQEQLFSCASNCAQEISDMTDELGLNRVIVAACSPRTLDPLFRDTVREAGLNQYYYDMANIREHCSWVHAKEKEEATEKAKDIIRMSVARTAHLEPLQEIELPVNKAALVVGGGIAGMTCALSIAKQGHVVHLVEKEKDLGGTARRIYHTLEGLDVQAYLYDLIQQVYQNPLVRVYTDAAVTEASGYIGNFTTTIESERGVTEIKHGATVIAVGADVYEPKEYLYGEDDRVLTHLELEEQIHNGDERLINADNLVMIQCVGCRNEDRNYCSRVCCNESIKNALKLKEIKPEMEIYVLYRDMRTYGFGEDYYHQAADNDVRFIRYEPQNQPELELADAVNDRPVLKVSAPDYVLGKKVEIDADIVVLAAAVIPSTGSEEISQLFNVSLNPDSFFQEAHVKLRPVEFATDGVFLCGAAHYPKMISETIKQASGAAGRALTLLSQDTVSASGSICEVVEKACIGCAQCVSACTYDAIELRDTRRGKKAVVNPVLCKGDGLCCSKCPTLAIQLKHFNNDEILAQIDAVTEPARMASMLLTEA
jgi:heterodisulfide reductase subunit A